MGLIYGIAIFLAWLSLAIGLLLFYRGSSLVVWAAYGAFFTVFFLIPDFDVLSDIFFIIFTISALLMLKPLRQTVISAPLLKLVKKMKVVPKVSETERLAVESGNAWMDEEVFSGNPDIARVSSQAIPALSKAEKQFLAGPVEEVASMTSDWEVAQKRELSKQTWDYLKKKKFLGMIIPKEYGGLGFSPAGHAAVIEKLASRCYPLCISVMVPNSLGPAELLLHYGTEKQKKHYLPRLADGREIPCFGLTERNAGSDAGSIVSGGEVFSPRKGQIAIRLNFEKRYITMAAISTVIGLAFRLRDPKNLLGKGTDLGITAALIPAKTRGIKLGRRHDPLSVPFYNCPVSGKNVVIGLDAIIGEEAGVGKGLQMIMESLAAGRGISLPATSTGSAKMVSRVVSAYAGIRKQFGTELYKFEGVEEKLAEVYGTTYMLNAGLHYMLKGLNDGAKPPVMSAIYKYHYTEASRKVINAGMDILAGAAISRGPRNTLAQSYFAAPISITVEGANIMTRSLIIFNQGIMRCHPHLYKVVRAIETNDKAAFDHQLFSLLGRSARNKVRFLLLSMSRGWVSLTSAFRRNGRYWRRVVWASAWLAFWSDAAIGVHGGGMKFRERLSARLGDVFSHLLLATATLNYFEQKKEPKNERDSFEWVMQHCFHSIDQATTDFYANFFARGPFFLKPLLAIYRVLFVFLSRLNTLSAKPNDKLEKRLVEKFSRDGVFRENMTSGIFIPPKKGKTKDDALRRLEDGLAQIKLAEKPMLKMRRGLKRANLTFDRGNLPQTVKTALSKKIINPEESKSILLAERVRNDLVAVDSFSLSEYKRYGLKVADAS